MTYEEIISILSVPEGVTFDLVREDAIVEFVKLAEAEDDGLMEYLQYCWPYTQPFREFLRDACPEDFAYEMYIQTALNTSLEDFWDNLEDHIYMHNQRPIKSVDVSYEQDGDNPAMTFKVVLCYPMTIRDTIKAMLEWYNEED